MTFLTEDSDVLPLARDWKAGRLGRVHPDIGHSFNRVLLLAGEDAVPFRRSTDVSAPSIPELIQARYASTRRPEAP